MNDKKKRGSGAVSIIATLIVAVAALAAVFVLVKMNRTEKKPQVLPDGTEVSFQPTQELADECGAAAQKLISGNIKAIGLFVSEGLPHLSEPYGNRPEDHLFTVNSDEFQTYEQLEAFVKSIYTEEEAARILTSMPSNPAGGNNSRFESEAVPEYIAVYSPREIEVEVSGDTEYSLPKVPEVVIPKPESGTSSDISNTSAESGAADSKPNRHFEKKTVLGISEYFAPNSGYNRPWQTISMKVLPANENECYLTVYLGADKDVILSSVGDEDILVTSMVKENGEWRLTKMIY